MEISQGGLENHHKLAGGKCWHSSGEGSRPSFQEKAMEEIQERDSDIYI